MLDVAARQQPDAFVYLGDNIYGDSYHLDTLRAKYGRLAARPEFRQLKSITPLFAVWDDHDFGWNDSGRHYPLKRESEVLFLDFWEVPPNSERRGRPGIYGVEYLEKEGKRVQLIMLDTRYFRDELRLRPEDAAEGKNDYLPNEDPDSTFLGASQWAWLEATLREPADARLIASSNQFSHEYNGWESWTNVPHERRRMIELIQRTGAERVVFMSGDVHWGELSRQNVAGSYPLYDLTSSGITETWPNTEPNGNRVGEVVPGNNVGMIDLWLGGASTDSIQFRLLTLDGTAAVDEKLPLRQLTR